MNNFVEIVEAELLDINGGLNCGAVFGGICMGVVGAGLLAAALVPGVNVIAVSALVMGSSLGVSSGITCVVVGLVR